MRLAWAATISDKLMACRLWLGHMQPTEDLFQKWRREEAAEKGCWYSSASLCQHWSETGLSLDSGLLRIRRERIGLPSWSEEERSRISPRASIMTTRSSRYRQWSRK